MEKNSIFVFLEKLPLFLWIVMICRCDPSVSRRINGVEFWRGSYRAEESDKRREEYRQSKDLRG